MDRRRVVMGSFGLLPGLTFRMPRVVSLPTNGITVPVPVMLLGLFTSGIQALVCSTLTGAYCGEAIEAALSIVWEEWPWSPPWVG